MTIELIETQSKNAFNRALNNLPVRNEPIIEVSQNTDTEILILVLNPNPAENESSFKGYTLAASKWDVFNWYWGTKCSKGVDIDEVLNNDIYTSYAEHYRKDWKEEKE